MILSPTGTPNDSPTIQSALNSNEVVEFEAGATFNVAAVVEVPAGRTLTTNAGNPATLKRTGSTIRTLVVNGHNILIENLRFDWNFEGVWKPFHSHIAMNPPGGSGIVATGQHNNTRIIGCKFIESTSPGTHNGQDCWCITLVPGVVNTSVSGVKILGCYSDSEVQLCGNGGINGTWSDVEIAYNVCYNGRNAGIGFSSLARVSNGNIATTFQDVNIHHNIFRNTYGIGIFVGQDNSAWTDGTSQINNLVISDNYIEAGKVADFNIPILIRPGREPGYTATATVERNVISILDAQKALKSPRTIQFNGETVGNTLLFRNNKRSGNGPAQYSNLVITQSGNTNLDGTVWTI